MKLLVCGDFVISKVNENYFLNGELNNVFDDLLLKKWNDNDFRIFNLEAPICRSNGRIKKSGPNLKINPLCMTGIKKMQPSLICLSNNHIMDYGSDGLKSTLNLLKENDINFIGAGSNILEAKNNCCFENDAIVVINCCEHEFSVAHSNGPGAFPYSDLDIKEIIEKYKKDGKYIIVVYHGGKEEYRYPSPQLLKRCRNMALWGANFITCQHTHCIGCFEKYNNCTILYGQGNFMFKGYKDNLFWKTGLLAEIDTTDKAVSFIPIISDEKIRLSSELEKKDIISSFISRSEEILKPGFVENEFKRYVRSNSISYLCKVMCYSKMRSYIERHLFRGFFVKRKIKRHSGLVLSNVLNCEPHIEILRAAVDDIISED